MALECVNAAPASDAASADAARNAQARRRVARTTKGWSRGGSSTSPRVLDRVPVPQSPRGRSAVERGSVRKGSAAMAAIAGEGEEEDLGFMRRVEVVALNADIPI